MSKKEWNSSLHMNLPAVKMQGLKTLRRASHMDMVWIRVYKYFNSWQKSSGQYLWHRSADSWAAESVLLKRKELVTLTEWAGCWDVPTLTQYARSPDVGCRQGKAPSGSTKVAAAVSCRGALRWHNVKDKRRISSMQPWLTYPWRDILRQYRGLLVWRPNKLAH